MAWLRQQWERFMRWVNHSDDPRLPDVPPDIHPPEDPPKSQGPTPP